MEKQSNVDLLAQLKVLSLVQVNDKLKTRGRQLTIEQPSVIEGFWRWWYQEGREHNVDTVKAVLDTAEDKIAFYGDQLRGPGPHREAAAEYLMRLAKELASAAEGLARYQHTYNRRPLAWSRIEVMMEDMHSWIARIGRLIAKPPVAAEPVSVAAGPAMPETPEPVRLPDVAVVSSSKVQFKEQSSESSSSFDEDGF